MRDETDLIQCSQHRVNLYRIPYFTKNLVYIAGRGFPSKLLLLLQPHFDNDLGTWDSDLDLSIITKFFTSFIGNRRMKD